jgi:hypothetical protein
VRIPVGKTYLSHCVCAFVALALGALDLSLKLRWIDRASAGNVGLLIAILAVIPVSISLLFAAYSLLTVLIALFHKVHVPRDMYLLPAGLVGFVGGSALSGEGWLPYLLLLGYLILTVTLVAQYQRGRRLPAQS